MHHSRRRRRRRRHRRAAVVRLRPRARPLAMITMRKSIYGFPSRVSFSFLYGYGAPLGGLSGRRSSAINRATLGRRGSSFASGLLIYIFLVLPVSSTKLPLGQTLNHATCDVYTPKTAETLIHSR